MTNNNLEIFVTSDGKIHKYDEEHPLWAVNRNHNQQIHSQISRRHKVRRVNDNQLERKMKIIERLKKKYEEKKKNDSH